MIICGYPGIGKSSIVRHYQGVIDLESSNFKIVNDWYKVYVNVAEDLDNQNYIVFLSTHKAVRDELDKRKLNYFIIYPSLDLENEWKERLLKRYTETPIPKNFRAFDRANCHFKEDITELKNSKGKKYEIVDISYRLEDIVDELLYIPYITEIKERNDNWELIPGDDVEAFIEECCDRELINDFIDKHKDCSGDFQFYKSSRSGIGCSGKIVCCTCHEEQDITDVDKW